ncbi:MAG: FAD-dependent oxidoreductase, partial [Clostridia bacterium]|nr:FAD-dependent oxidoreductase [Clostridia bacterium]
MTTLNNIKISPHRDGEAELRRIAAAKMGIPRDKLGEIRITKRSIDARRKDAVSIIYSLECAKKGEPLPVAKTPDIAVLSAPPTLRPIVVGSGPAGMMCALTLAKAGARPIVIERGQPAPQRTEAVERYFGGGELDTECNVQFGEGGAGTFSDGKLTTGIRDVRIATVMREFVEAGAPPEILYQAKPHIGTDKLREMVVAIRHKIESLGGEYRFGTRLDDIIVKGDRISSIILSCGGVQQEIPCEALVLATGHSARDTFEMLHRHGIVMEQKAFSMGARIEHPQSLIDKAQYGAFVGLQSLGAADYKLAAKTDDGRGVYTFCMCPGGRVVAAASEDGSIVTNGMSLYARADENANSAVLVGITPRDFESEHPLAGMLLQRKVERAAYAATGCSKAPAQLVGDLLARRPSESIGSVRPSYRPGVVMGDIGCCLPGFIVDAIAQGCTIFGRKIRGFDAPDAILTAPETRSSSPVRILRDDSLQASVRGIYPCGEGAGYAGGITSAAVDGIRCAE